MITESRLNFKLENTNSNNTNAIKELEKELYELYSKDECVTGTETNGKNWEILDKHLLLDPYNPYINVFREFKHDYLEREHKWYMSTSLSVNGYMDDVKIWQMCATKDGCGEINSNYGYLVFSPENYNQFDYCLNKLKYDKNSREAMIIYTRPSIQIEATEKGKKDFICTNYSHFFIRNNKLEMIHSQRSCDAITGLPFDFAWSCFVYQNLYNELKQTYPDLEVGKVHYNIDSLHIYDRSEKLLKNYGEKNV